MRMLWPRGVVAGMLEAQMNYEPDSISRRTCYLVAVASCACTRCRNGRMGETPHSAPLSDHNSCSFSSLASDATSS